MGTERAILVGSRSLCVVGLAAPVEFGCPGTAKSPCLAECLGCALMEISAKVAQTSCAGVTAQSRAVPCPGLCAEEAEVPGWAPGADKLFGYRITGLTRLRGGNSSARAVGLICPLACDDKAASSTWSRRKGGEIWLQCQEQHRHPGIRLTPSVAAPREVGLVHDPFHAMPSPLPVPAELLGSHGSPKAPAMPRFGSPRQQQCRWEGAMKYLWPH